MRNSIFQTILVLMLLPVVLSGCGEYSKVSKSKDPDVKYRAALKYVDTEKYSKAIQLFEEITHFYINTPREDTVSFYLAYSYYKNGDFDMSSMLFDNFRKSNSRGHSPFLEEAEYMYAKGFYFASPAPNRDQTATRQALMAIDEYLVRYPNSVKRDALEENITELLGKLHDKAYINAKSYYTTGRYKSAVVALKNALAQYPTSRHREELMYLIVKSSYLLADNSVQSLQRDRYLDMMDAYYNFVSEYKDSKYTKELNKMQDNAKNYLARFNDPTNTENLSSYDGN